MEKLILKKLGSLNQVSKKSLTDENNTSIIKNFTEESIKILGADFGFAWGKFNGDDEYKLTYKSAGTPENLGIPKEKTGKNKINRKGYVFFDSKVNKGDYEPDISNHIKSFIMIPIRYGDHVYGSIILCYKKEHNITPEDLALSENAGNAVANVVTINWLIEKEQEALVVAKKQKEIQVLLDQEKVKTEFIANATHELRTPLAIMRGNVDLALGGNETKKLKSAESALKDIKQEIDHLTAIISDLATMTSTIGNVKNVIKAEKINLVDLLKKCVGRLRVILHKKRVKVKINTGKVSEIWIDGDKQYLEKLFLNLIRNSTTYGKEKGEIIIDAKINKDKAIIKVTDNGIGIPKKDLPHVFERFYRTEKARTITNIGTGLGLSISRWITDNHGGTIEAASTEGKGSTFTVTLPTPKS